MGTRTTADLSHWELIGTTPLETSELPSGLYRLKAVREGSSELERADGVFARKQISDSVFQRPRKRRRIWFEFRPLCARPAGSLHFRSPLLSRSLGFGSTRMRSPTPNSKPSSIRGATKSGISGIILSSRMERPFPGSRRWRSFRDATGRHGPGTWQLGTYPEGRGSLSRERCQLVRSRGVCPVCRQSLADRLSLVPRSRRGRVLRDPEPQQLRRTGPGAGGKVPRTWDFRNV